MTDDTPDDEEQSTELAIQLTDALTAWTQRQHEPVPETVIGVGRRRRLHL